MIAILDYFEVVYVAHVVSNFSVTCMPCGKLAEKMFEMVLSINCSAVLSNLSFL
jgi:hypothetical protein